MRATAECGLDMRRSQWLQQTQQLYTFVAVVDLLDGEAFEYVAKCLNQENTALYHIPICDIGLSFLHKADFINGGFCCKLVLV